MALDLSLFSILINGSLLFLSFIFFIAVYECITYIPFIPAIKKSRSLGNKKFDEKKLPETIDAIIVGSGQGGLSCGAVLSQFGKKVVVCEQHEVTGGGTHTFSVGGESSKYKFNAGHHLSIPLHEHILQVTCGASKPPVPFGILKDKEGANDHVIFGCKPRKNNNETNDIDETDNGLQDDPLPIKDDVWVLNELCQRFPNHRKEINSYFTLAETIQLKFALLIGVALLPNWLRGLFILSPMMSIWRLWAGKTTAEGLKDLIPGDDEDSRKLRSYAIGLWLDVGSPPARSSFFMQTAVFGGWQKVGVAYPKGSPQAIALAMCEVIERNQGNVFISCPVIKIILNEKKTKAIGVQLSNGKELYAPIIISGLGYRVTESLLYSHLHENENKKSENIASSSTLKESKNNMTKTTNHYTLETKQGCGFIMANIGLKGKAKDLGITVTNLWLQPACKENGWDALKGVEDYWKDPLNVPFENIPAGICFPSTKDGRTNVNINEDDMEHHTCQILVPGEWSWFEKYAPKNMKSYIAKEPFAKHSIPSKSSKSKGASKGDRDEEGSASDDDQGPNAERQFPEEYEALKSLWANRLLSLLFLHYPKIHKNKDSIIEFVNISTPLTIENYTRPGLGAAIGLDVTPERFINLKEFEELNHKHPRILNFWRVGQDYLMTGQVLAAASGIICALRILGPISIIRFIIRCIKLLLPRLWGAGK